MSVGTLSVCAKAFCVREQCLSLHMLSVYGNVVSLCKCCLHAGMVSVCGNIVSGENYQSVETFIVCLWERCLPVFLKCFLFGFGTLFISVVFDLSVIIVCLSVCLTVCLSVYLSVCWNVACLPMGMFLAWMFQGTTILSIMTFNLSTISIIIQSCPKLCTQCNLLSIQSIRSQNQVINDS